MRPKDRVRWLSREMHPIVRPGVADRIFLSIPIALIKKMHLPLPDKSRGSTKTFGFAGMLRFHLGLLFPPNHIRAGCDSYFPSRVAVMGRNRVIHPILPLEFHHRGILGKRFPSQRSIPIHHHPPLIEGVHIHSLLPINPFFSFPPKRTHQQNPQPKGEAIHH